MGKRAWTVFIVALCLLSFSLAHEHDPTTQVSPDKAKEVAKEASEQVKASNPWNETVVVSSTWQTVLDGLFGLNLEKDSFKKGEYITVREAIVLFAIFMMFLVILLDIFSFFTFFETKVMGMSLKGPIAFVATLIVSVTGSFNNLKDFFLGSVNLIMSEVDWPWLNWLITNKTWGIVLTLLVLGVLFFLFHKLANKIIPRIKRLNDQSRAKAKANLLNEQIKAREVQEKIAQEKL